MGSPRCVGALLVKDEAAPDRYLARAVENALQFCDALVVVDDGSTDGSARSIIDLCVVANRPCRVERLEGGFWGGDETTPRALLWRLAAEEAGPEGWVYVFDADHLLSGGTPADFRLLLTTTTRNAWAFPLYDLWDSEAYYRMDSYWMGHLLPRVWLAKAHPKAGWEPDWGPPRSLHAGHLPPNYPVEQAQAPVPWRILHLSYVNPEHRRKKAERYLAVSTLSESERAHAASILEPAVLAPLTPPPPRILVGSVVRKPPEVLQAFLATLSTQVAEATCDYLFVLDLENTPFKKGAQRVLEAFANAHPGRVRLVLHTENAGTDYKERTEERTRGWTPQAWHRVGGLKNAILHAALQEGYAFCWLVDADVNCEPYTLQSLLDQQAPVVSAVYWTHWQRPIPGEVAGVHAGPQVWMTHPYGMAGNYFTAQEFRAALLARQRLQVGGLGACTLFRQDALAKGLNFAPVGDLPPGPMSDGEDRHLCIRAAQLHIPLFADPWPDVYHAYHPEEYDQLPGEVARLNVPRGPRARLGDLVSAKLELLEPLPGGQWVGPQWVRGRLGAMPLLPEVEALLARLPRRESALQALHFPTHWPLPPLAGQTRLCRVTMLDYKPFRLPPTVERELLLDSAANTLFDPVDHPLEALRAMQSSAL